MSDLRNVKRRLAVLLLALTATPGLALAQAPKPQAAKLTDAQIRKILIAESVAAYLGNCPWLYNTARNGSACDERSAYSRSGGAAPLCYPKDVTDQMVQEYARAAPMTARLRTTETDMAQPGATRMPTTAQMAPR